MKKYGFTLIELMIVVAIIVFLAVLAVPQLFHYKAKAYQASVAESEEAICTELVSFTLYPLLLTPRPCRV